MVAYLSGKFDFVLLPLAGLTAGVNAQQSPQMLPLQQRYDYVGSDLKSLEDVEVTRTQPGFIDVADSLNVPFLVLCCKLFAEAAIVDFCAQGWAVLGKYVFGDYFAFVPFRFGEETVDDDSIGIEELPNFGGCDFEYCF